MPSLPAMEEKRQWPDNICSGPIRYGRSNNYDGFYLADAEHGIPTFASVSPTSPITVRGQHVRVFNYPGQTEAIAEQLVHRWNCHDDMLAALKLAVDEIEQLRMFAGNNGAEIAATEFVEGRAAIAKATEGK